MSIEKELLNEIELAKMRMDDAINGHNKAKNRYYIYITTGEYDG